MARGGVVGAGVRPAPRSRLELGIFVGGLAGSVAAMTFFMWRRDLLAMIVFHLTTDAIGLVIAPAFGEWWRTPALS